MLLPLFLIRKKLLADTAKLGRWGEIYCERYLKRKGFKSIARNFHKQIGEIDLIMDDDGTIVFVEVKTRRNEDFVEAQKAVNFTKQQKMLKTAKSFMKQYKITERPFRFDVVAIVLPEKSKPQVRHYKNAVKIR